MTADPSRLAGGALAGSIAAFVWAAQQPLDKAVFGVDYDDCELLGTQFTDGRAALPLGWALHCATGAAFGAAYAAVGDRIPLPRQLRAPAMAVAENTALWPLSALLPRIHRRGKAAPRLWGTPHAFAQATWRHVLFGVVLGELEHRFNRREEPEEENAFEHVVSTNGHGDIRRAVVEIAPE